MVPFVKPATVAVVVAESTVMLAPPGAATTVEEVNGVLPLDAGAIQVIVAA